MTEGNVNVICFGSFPVSLLLDENNENGRVVDVEENRQKLQEEEEEKGGGRAVDVAVGKESRSLSPEIGAKDDVNQEGYQTTFVEEEHRQESEHQNDLSNASSPRVSCSEEEKEEEEEAANLAEEASENEDCCEAGAGSALETCISEINDNCNNGDDDCNDAAVRGPEIPRPLPPVLASADQRSITVAWEACPMPVSYYLDTACNEVVEESLKNVHFILSPSALDLKWTSVYCSNERNYKVERLKPGSSYSFRLRVIPITVPPLAPPPWPLPSEIAVFSTPPDVPCPPPALVLVNRARTSLKVRWVPPLETGGVPILKYMLDITPLPGKLDADVALPPTSDGFVQLYIGEDTAYRVTRLLPGSVYRFRVLAVNSIGRSEYSREASFSTDASVPAAPLAPTLVSTSASSMIVKWQEPQNCGSPITAYTLECDDGNGGPFVSVYTGEKCGFEMEGLRSGLVYRVRVMAHNDEGRGAFSVPAGLHTNFSTPNPPPPPVITGRSTNSVIITWCSPEEDGGSEITAYELEMGSGSHEQGPEVAANWSLIHYGLGQAHTWTGLSPGHQYRVRVRAVNLMGKGGYSGEASFSTSPGPPGPPSPPTSLEVGSLTLALGWRPPAHDGGSSVTSFRLEMTSLGQNGGELNLATTVREEHGVARSFVSIYQDKEARFVVEGLDPGSNYGFRVLAVNKLGSGTHSGLSILRTRAAPPTVPAAPVISGDPFATSLTVRWYPSENNGAPIQSYSLQMLVLGYGGQCFPSFETGLSVNGYELQRQDSCKHMDVASLGGDRGRSDTSSPFSHEMSQSPSHSISSASSRGTSIWDTDKFVQKRKPLHSNAGTSEDESDLQEGLAKVGDERSLSLGSTANERQRDLALQDVYYGSNTVHTIKKLQPFTSYAFRVQAHNEAGPSGFSSFVVGMTSSAAPSAPCAPTVLDTTSSSLTLRWEVPGQDNGSPVYRYILEMMKVGSDMVTLPTKERKNNSTNRGKKSSNRKNINQDLAALTGGQPSGWGKVYDGNALEYSIVELLPSTQYSFRVAAHNDMGTSPSSPSVGFTTLASAPEAPQSPLFSAMTPTSVRIRWSAPACDNGMPVTSYKLMMDDGKEGQLRRVYEGAATHHKATKLVPASSYCVAVQAVNALGASPLSEIGTVKLPIAPPRTPPTPKVKGGSEKSVSVHWLEVPKNNESAQQLANSVHLSDGVAETLSYTLEMEDLKKAGTFRSLYDGPATSFEVPNLVSEHKYRFRVRANGAQGPSAWSAWSSPITISRQSSTLQVKGKSSLVEDLAMSMTLFAQKAGLQLPESWSPMTLLWMVLALGVAVAVAVAVAIAYFAVN